MPRGRKPRYAYHLTPGGERLRQLREQAKLTLADVEDRTGDQVTTAQLHRIEVGETKRPDYETLRKILSALQARYFDQREIMWSFGYRLSSPLPTPEEIDHVRERCIDLLNDATIPMYLVDDGLRMWDWNRYVPRLIGRHPDDPALEQFRGVTTLDLAFNPLYKTTFLVDNPEEYLPLLVNLVKTALQPFHEEPWYASLLERARMFPRFSELWDTIKETPIQRGSAQHITPIRIDVPQVGLLQFRLSSSHIVVDRRFQTVQYVPFGATTLRQCAIWAEEDGKI